MDVRQSAKFVTERAKHIKIGEQGAKKVAQMIIDAIGSEEIHDIDFDAHEIHPKTGDEKAVDWVFFMDAINFSFWTELEDKFEVTYKGNLYTGYFAGCACVNRALDEGIPLTTAKFMSTIDVETLTKIFTSDSGKIIPMIGERVTVLNDVGKVLVEKFDGSFFNCIKQCGNSAKKLLDMITENFEWFRDYAMFHGERVALLKRAQILVADVYGCLKKTNLAQFPDISYLTMFADYRVPQALNFLGAIEYSDELNKILEKKLLLENGSELEVEIRAFSIEACELIVDECKKLTKPSGDASDRREVTAMDVDMFLWVYRRKHANEIELHVPFHRVRCVYY